MKPILYLLLVSISLVGDTLNELVDYAMANAPVVKQTQAEITRAALQHQQSKAAQYGTLELVADYTHYNTERTLAPLSPNAIGSGTPITTTKDLVSAGVRYGVPLFTGFSQTRRIEIAALGNELEHAKGHLSREQIVYNIRALYLSILSLQELYFAQQHYSQALEQLKKQIAYEVELGKKASLDLLKVRADLYASQTQEARFQADMDIAKATLSAMVGKEVNGLEALEIDVSPPDYNIDRLYATSTRLSKVALEQIKVRQAEKKEAQTRSSQFPQLSFNAYYGKNYGEDIQRSQWDHETLWQAGIHAQYTLWDFGLKSMQTQAAAVATLKASLHKEQTLLDLKKLIAHAVAKVNRSYTVYLGMQAQMQLTQESERIERVRYENGVATLNDLLLAKGKYHIAKAKVIESKYGYQRDIYYIDYVMEQGAPQ